MKHVHALLKYFHLEDKYHTISLTTIAFIVAMYCILFGKKVDLTTLGTFVAALGAHQIRQKLERGEGSGD